jgi:hypothetical protein
MLSKIQAVDLVNTLPFNSTDSKASEHSFPIPESLIYICIFLRDRYIKDG